MFNLPVVKLQTFPTVSDFWKPGVCIPCLDKVTGALLQYESKLNRATGFSGEELIWIMNSAMYFSQTLEITHLKKLTPEVRSWRNVQTTAHVLYDLAC